MEALLPIHIASLIQTYTSASSLVRTCPLPNSYSAVSINALPSTEAMPTRIDTECNKQLILSTSSNRPQSCRMVTSFREYRGALAYIVLWRCGTRESTPSLLTVMGTVWLSSCWLPGKEPMRKSAFYLFWVSTVKHSEESSIFLALELNPSRFVRHQKWSSALWFLFEQT